MSGPTPTLDTIAEDLHRIYPGVPGLVAVTCLPGGASRFFATTELDRAARHAARMARTHNVYAMVSTLATPPAAGRGGAGDAVALGSVVLDVDCAGPGHAEVSGRLTLPDREEALALLAALPVPPSVLIDTGHGFLARWLLAEPVVIADGTDRRRAVDLAQGWNRLAGRLWADHGCHLDNVGDLARLTRVAGTYNRKREPVVPVQVVEAHPGCRYRPEDLARHVPAPALAAPAPRRLQPPIRPRLAGAESPAEAFARVVSWADILEPAGFVLMYDRGDIGYWHHQASTSGRSSVSATTDVGAPVAVVHSESAAAATGLPAGPGRKLTRFRTWSWLHFGGDERAAARALVELGRRSS